jgi:two-component system sensor histidine kinase GlrK
MERVLERKQIMVDAELRRARLKEEKEQLVSHLSHECRNALACIHQFGNILVDGLAGEMSQEQREYIGIMLENSSRIRSVLDGLLEAAPGEARTVC